MSAVKIEPAGAEIWDAISLHHDFDCDPKDAEVSLAQRDPSDINMNNAEVICFHPDRIPALINALFDLHAVWHEPPKAHEPGSGDLYHEPK